MPFQSGKIIFVGRGSKGRLNPSLSGIRVITTFKSDVPLEPEGVASIHILEKEEIRRGSNRPCSDIKTPFMGLSTDIFSVFFEFPSGL